jgi:uncharacterized protein YydD (DUF2326 family)
MHRDDSSEVKEYLAKIDQLKEELARKELDFRDSNLKCDEYCSMLQENADAIEQSQKLKESLTQKDAELSELTRQLERAKKLKVNSLVYTVGLKDKRQNPDKRELYKYLVGSFKTNC